MGQGLRETTVMDLETEVFAGRECVLSYAPEGHYTVVTAPRCSEVWRVLMTRYRDHWPLRVNGSDYQWLQANWFAPETFERA